MIAVYKIIKCNPKIKIKIKKQKLKSKIGLSKNYLCFNYKTELKVICGEIGSIKEAFK
jgi:hypothetical protein|tara:strand:- start:354 stop:527 length:174 start_codon:yes stop_codon:yes gene_type:complete